MTRPADAATVAGRLGELRARYDLTTSQVGQLRCLLEVLASDPLAPTSVTKPLAAIDVHLADSLTALDVDGVREARRIADLGSGAGFPGLPLAAALPHAHVSLVESAVAALRVPRARARRPRGWGTSAWSCGRAEAWAGDTAAHEQDVVTARAVAPLDVLCEYAAPLLRARRPARRVARAPGRRGGGRRRAGGSRLGPRGRGPRSAASRILGARNITCTST